MRQLAGAFLAVGVLLASLIPPASAEDAGNMLAQVNMLRVSRGVAPLIDDPTASLAAQQWSAHMAATGRLAHNPAVASMAGRVGENVGMGGSLAAIFNALSSDAPHLANMVQPGYHLTGIAVATDAHGLLWLTEDFEAVAGSIQPAGSPAPAVPAPPAPPAAAPVPAPVRATPPPVVRPAARNIAVPPAEPTTTPTTAPTSTSTTTSTTVTLPPMTSTTETVVPGPELKSAPASPKIVTRAISTVGPGRGHRADNRSWGYIIVTVVILGGVRLLATRRQSATRRD